MQNFQILDSDDQQRLVKRVIRELGLDEQRWPARQAQWFINGQKDEGLRPQHIQAGGDLFLGTMRSIYEAYEQACERAGVIDFSELLLRAWTCGATTLGCSSITSDASVTCWWMSSRTPTPCSTPGCAYWLARTAAA